MTPTLNQGTYLEATINSVLSQLRSQDYYIVVDGGSTDSTHEVLARYSDRIDRIVNKPGSSQAEAIGHGFDLALRPYCCWLNSDDIFLPGALVKAVRALEQNTDVDCVYSHRVFIDGDGQVTSVWRLPPHIEYLMSRWDYIPQETAFWRFDAMQKAGGIDTSLNFAVDYDLFLKMLRVGRFRRVDDFFAAFRKHPASKTSLQMDDIGRSEVSMLREKYGRHERWYDWILAGLLGRHIKWRANRYLDNKTKAILQKEIDTACGLTIS